jgi:NADH-quinone oxidoreductase subunit E
MSASDTNTTAGTSPPAASSDAPVAVVVLDEQDIPVDQIETIIASYPSERRHALAMMQDIQRRFDYLPRVSLELLAKHLDCPVVQLYSMATFYKALSLKPKGRHIIKVCDGTACHIKGSLNLVDGIERVLGIRPGDVTPDGQFSLETVNCLGSCALAPVLLIDDTHFGKVTQEKLPEIIDSYRVGGERDE